MYGDMAPCPGRQHQQFSGAAEAREDPAETPEGMQPCACLDFRLHLSHLRAQAMLSLSHWFVAFLLQLPLYSDKDLNAGMRQDRKMENYGDTVW